MHKCYERAALGGTKAGEIMICDNPGGVICKTENLLVSKAQRIPGVAKCITDANAPGYEISAMISNSDFYFRGGFLKVVTFYKVRKRKASFPRLSTTIVAEVLFNSDDEIIGTECFV